jgi:hypothetical protein
LNRKRRTTLLVVTASLTAVALAGCSPRETAVMGVGVDDDRSPVAYVIACRDSIDFVSLTQPGKAQLGEWGAPKPVTGMASVRLRDGSPGWTVFGDEAPVLAPGITYELSGWEDSRDAVTAMEVEFTVEDLAALRPGEIRRRAGVDARGERAYVVESEDEFAANACAELRS